MAFLISYLASRTYVTLRGRKQGGQAMVEYRDHPDPGLGRLRRCPRDQRRPAPAPLLQRHLRVRALPGPRARSHADPDAGLRRPLPRSPGL